jgi:hypothetical protein
MSWADGGLNGDGFFGEEYEDQLESYPYTKKRKYNSNFSNPLYYYENVNVNVKRETEKAYLFEDSKGEYWIPKSLTRRYQYGWMKWNKFIPKYITTSKRYIRGVRK